MNFGSIARDFLAPAAGAIGGYYFGGAPGAGWGAAGARGLGGLLTDEDPTSTIKNAALAGGIGYGAGYGANQYLGDWSPGVGAGWGSAGASTPAAAQGGASGGGLFSGGGWKMPAAMMGINAVSQMYGADAAKKNAEDIYGRQMAGWNQTAFPNAANVNAQQATAVSGINQQSMLARRKLMEEMAARGMGQSSGVMAGAMAEEDRARRQRLAMLANNMIQFQNTPRWAPPQYQGTQSGGERLADTTSETAGLMAGMGLYNY